MDNNASERGSWFDLYGLLHSVRDVERSSVRQPADMVEKWGNRVSRKLFSTVLRNLAGRTTPRRLSRSMRLSLTVATGSRVESGQQSPLHLIADVRRGGGSLKIPNLGLGAAHSYMLKTKQPVLCLAGGIPCRQAVESGFTPPRHEPKNAYRQRRCTAPRRWRSRCDQALPRPLRSKLPCP